MGSSLIPNWRVQKAPRNDAKGGFQITSVHKPAGDQGNAISTLARGLKDGKEFQTILRVTGSDKTFTMAGIDVRAAPSPNRCRYPARHLAGQPQAPSELRFDQIDGDPGRPLVTYESLCARTQEWITNPRLAKQLRGYLRQAEKAEARERWTAKAKALQRFDDLMHRRGPESVREARYAYLLVGLVRSLR